MRMQFYACIFIVGIIFNTLNSTMPFYSAISLNGIENAKQDPVEFFAQHIDEMKRYMQTFKVESISFPVQQHERSDAVFTRKGLLALRPNALGTVIICHGYTHSKHEAFFFRTLFPHFNVLVFDFRAHGELIEGQYSTIGSEEIFDVFGAVQFVKTHPQLKNKPIIGFGFSMGAVSLLQAQAHFKDMFDLLILDSPFDSSSDCMENCIDRLLTYRLFGKTYRFPGKWLIMKSLYNPRLVPLMKPLFRWASGLNVTLVKTKFLPVIPIQKAPDIQIPCFFITCEKDNKVPVESVSRLYEAVQSPYKRLWITGGYKHCGSCLFNPELYSYRVNKFIQAVLSKGWSKPTKIYDERVLSEVV